MIYRAIFSFFAGVCLSVLLASAAAASTQGKAAGAAGPSPTARASFTKAVVIDERLSALRREADIHAPVLKRLRVGRAVYVTSAKSARSTFYRVAVTRRTRGWIHQGAIALVGRAGEDERVLRVIEE